MDRESSESVTALGVETILAALTESRLRQTPRAERVREATEVSEVDRHNRLWNLVSCKRELGRKLPTKPGDPLKRFERRETLESSVLRGATFQVYAGREP